MQQHISQMESERTQTAENVIDLKRNKCQRNIELWIEVREDIAKVFEREPPDREVFTDKERVIDWREVLEKRMTKSQEHNDQ